jgi:hypothetical protein
MSERSGYVEGPNEALIAENLRLRAELAAARDAALEEAALRLERRDRLTSAEYIREMKGPRHD